MTFISPISARKTLATARRSGLPVGDYIDQDFESGVMAATVQVIPSLPQIVPSLPQADLRVKVGSEGGTDDSCSWQYARVR
jgi:hypothetical protein